MRSEIKRPYGTRPSWAPTWAGAPASRGIERLRVVQDIKNNKLFLFVYGETRYRDIFNKPHRTTWCFYNPEPSVPASKSRHCNVWNHAE